MKKLIEDLAKYIVDQPDQVRVEEIKEDENNITLELYVADEDIGRIIGRRGNIAKNIRNILRAISLKNEINYNLKIME